MMQVRAWHSGWHVAQAQKTVAAKALPSKASPTRVLGRLKSLLDGPCADVSKTNPQDCGSQGVAPGPAAWHHLGLC